MVKTPQAQTFSPKQTLAIRSLFVFLLATGTRDVALFNKARSPN